MCKSRVLGRVRYAEPVESGQREDVDGVVLNGIISEAPAIAPVDKAKKIVSTIPEYCLGEERLYIS